MKRKLWLFPLVSLSAALFVFTSFGTAVASVRGTSSAVQPLVNVTGTWNFVTTDSLYPTFILTLQQNGTMLSGQDQFGQPVSGSVHGNYIKFKVTGVSSEDDYGGQGPIISKGVAMRGSFWDAFGGGGTFQAVNLAGVWNFITTDSLYPSFTLTITQTGSQLGGHDQGGQPVSGSVSGFSINFTVTGVSQEDDYGGQGSFGPKGKTMAGSFSDGFGGGGTFTARRAGF